MAFSTGMSPLLNWAINNGRRNYMCEQKYDVNFLEQLISDADDNEDFNYKNVSLYGNNDLVESGFDSDSQNQYVAVVFIGEN